MLRVLIGFSALLLSLPPSASIRNLWKEYEKADKADSPKEQIAILQKIKKKSSAEKSAWDYYHAGELYVNVESRRNWKLRDSLKQAFSKELEAYGEPALLVYDRKDGLEDGFLEANRKRLEKCSNPKFWENDYRISRYKYSEVLVGNFENDYDYACWISRIDNFVGRYPLDALFEYSKIGYDDTAALKDFAHRYEGQAAGLLAEESLLWKKYSALSVRNGISEEFLALKAECEGFNARRAGFMNSEKCLAGSCNGVDLLLEELTNKTIEAFVKDGTLFLVFKNLPQARVQISKEGKSVFKETIQNPYRSFCHRDTVRTILPAMDDGEYELEFNSGDIREKGNYLKYSLSFATKRDNKGAYAYVADSKSGEPVDGKGFFPLKKGLDKYSYSYRDSSGRLKSTIEAYVNTDPKYSDTEDNWHLHCRVLTDRAVFHPGDSVNFKAIFYRGRFSLRAPGKRFTAYAALVDESQNEIERIELTPNDFGSVAGSFQIKNPNKNGLFRIFIYEKDKRIGNASIRVEDIELPTYYLEFDGGTFETLSAPLDSVTITGTLSSYSGHPLSSANVSYRLVRAWDEDKAESGSLHIDQNGRFSLRTGTGFKADSWNNNLSFTVKVTDLTGETAEFRKIISSRRSERNTEKKTYFFEELPGEGINLRVVAGNKPVWAIAELYGAGDVLLKQQMLHFEPVNGTASTTISYAYEDSYPDVVSLNVLYFQNEECYQHSMVKRREIHTWDLPVAFSRFTDTTRPNTGYAIRIKTSPEAECAAVIYDSSAEEIKSNKWSPIRASLLPVPYPSLTFKNGRETSWHIYGRSPKGVMKSLGGEIMDYHEEVVEEEAIPFQIVGYNSARKESMADSVPEESVRIRSNMAETIAWEPFLYPDAEGNIEFSFKTADKISTYCVQLFAHNKKMQNDVIRKNMVITIPVKTAVSAPAFLYCGDLYKAGVSVSNSTDRDICGQISLNDGKGVRICVPASGQASQFFAISAEKEGDLPLKAVFTADDSANGSDGILLTIPVKRPEQTITEAHSALLLQGQDKEALIRTLRSQFKNTSGEDAGLTEISILDMIKEALPEEITPGSDNILALCRALRSRMLLESMGQPASDTGSVSTEKLLGKIAACRNSDGGYGWFAGMSSNALLTAVVLENLKGVLPDTESAVKYLDTRFFKDKLPYWRGGLSLEQYLYIRSQYADVELSYSPDNKMKKAVREYLVPTGRRGPNGYLFRKARRIMTLRNFLSDGKGLEFVGKFGIRLFSESRLRKSEGKDMASLAQYAVEHPSGGVYFPNAVMPWRGLMESELYAHTLLSRLFDGYDDRIANGIRLWTMVQKETQKWDSDPAYIDAVKNVLEAPEDILATRVIALKSTFTKPFSTVEASGNGFSIEGGSVTAGKVGDKVCLEYRINNDENRSFVKISLPFPAGLTPVDRLSGFNYLGAYRSVRDDRIEYWFDSYPEGATSIKEEFYVTREGEFQYPASTIECLYADHYRANGAANEIWKTTE